MSNKFEKIEHQMFGANRFEDAVRQIEDRENSLGFANLPLVTALPTPKT